MSTKKMTFFPSYDSVPDEYRHGRSLALGTDVIAVIREINDKLTKLATDRDALLAACEVTLTAIKTRTLAHIAVDTRNAKFDLTDNYPTITRGEEKAEKYLVAAIAQANKE